VPEVQALRGLRLRPPPLPARRVAAAGRAAPGARRDHDLLALAAAPGARRGGAGTADPPPPGRLLHGVRLPDQPAGPDLRRARGAPARVHQPVRLDGLQGPAGTRGLAVQADRRGAAVELPERPALHRRAREAGLRGLPLPIWVSGRGARLRVYGQVRPARTARRRPCGSRCGRRRRRVRDGQDGHRALARGQFPRRVPRRPASGGSCGAAGLPRGDGSRPR
jgi:hypothetical protein